MDSGLEELPLLIKDLPVLQRPACPIVLMNKIMAKRLGKC